MRAPEDCLIGPPIFSKPNGRDDRLIKAALCRGKNADIREADRDCHCSHFLGRHRSIRSHEVVVLPNLPDLSGDVEVDDVATVVEPIPNLKDDAPSAVVERMTAA
jgi:hypothetical protein